MIWGPSAMPGVEGVAIAAVVAGLTDFCRRTAVGSTQRQAGTASACRRTTRACLTLLVPLALVRASHHSV